MSNGSEGAAQETIARVRSIHERVTGIAPDGRRYAASDPHLLTWVHIAEADSFLRAHTQFGAEPLDQAGRDGYVADMARIGAELGVADPPMTERELTERITAYRAELASTAGARAAARFLLLNPPLPVIARPPYGLLAAAAVALLPAGGADRAHPASSGRGVAGWSLPPHSGGGGRTSGGVARARPARRSTCAILRPVV